MRKLLTLVALLETVTVVPGASAFHHTGLPATFCAAALAGSPSNDTGNAKEAILAHRPVPTLPLPRAGTPGNG